MLNSEKKSQNSEQQKSSNSYRPIFFFFSELQKIWRKKKVRIVRSKNQNSDYNFIFFYCQTKSRITFLFFKSCGRNEHSIRIFKNLFSLTTSRLVNIVKVADFYHLFPLVKGHCVRPPSGPLPLKARYRNSQQPLERTGSVKSYKERGFNTTVIPKLFFILDTPPHIICLLNSKQKWVTKRNGSLSIFVRQTKFDVSLCLRICMQALYSRKHIQQTNIMMLFQKEIHT